MSWPADKWDIDVPETPADVIALLLRRIQVHEWWRDNSTPESVAAGIGAPEVHQAYIDQYKGAIRVIRKMKEALEQYARSIHWVRAYRSDRGLGPTRCVFTVTGHGFELAQEALAELKETNDEH